MNPSALLTRPSDLLFDQLRDLYSAECQVILTLPALVDDASHPKLRRLLSAHEKESMRQKDRLLTIFERYHCESDGDICKAMKGLIKGGNEHIARAEPPVMRDLLLIAHCNRIKHYEIAGYRFAAALARCLDWPDETAAISASLEEEEACARRLGEIAGEIFSPEMAEDRREVECPEP